MPGSLRKQPAIRSNAIRAAANGAPCMVCGNLTPTTVFAHLNESYAGKGLGIKADDFAGFFACQMCHDQYDGRQHNAKINDWSILRAVVKTWRYLIDAGVIEIRR